MIELQDYSTSARAAPLQRGRFVRAALAAGGGALVAIGVLGIFLPLLPTTVFFIAAAACFARSSPSAHRWLTTNRLFGDYLRNYHEGRGATVGTKVFSVGSLWAGIGLSSWFLGPPWWVELGLLAIAVAVTLHLLTLRTIRP
ncbi:MAG: YbaN family protein [Thermoflexaceae bacterium]|nr:YbaN family protein [Thermoflexaceae bacterium]